MSLPTPAALAEALQDRYVLERELGRGGMATVWLARDLRHQRPVALKVLHAELAASLGPDRFLREIHTTARLEHPHILPVFDSGDAGGLLWYTMPYVEGESLRDRLRRQGQLPLDEAVRIGHEVADALDCAHRHGIVHRDIKPENVLLGSGHARVADFGIARAVEAAGATTLTETGLAVGTPAYMSPEQASAGAVDARTDIYSLGCVLYEMLAGEPPHTGPSVHVLIARRLSGEVPSVRQRRPAVPPAVDQVIARALAPNPADRFQTAEELAQSLIDATRTGAAAVSAAVPRQPRSGRRYVMGALAAALLAAAGVIVGNRRTAGPTSATDAPAWVLVSDFDGPPGDRSLAHAARELIAVELDQSRTIASLPRAQLLEVMRDAGLPDTVTLTVERARELAVRSAVRTIVGGSVLPVSPGHYSIVIRALDADSGRTLFAVSGAASDEDLVPALQDAARRVRRRLGDRLMDIAATQPLMRVATPSFPAFRKFVQAVEVTDEGDPAGSNRLLRESVTLDTGFAAAWGAMGINYITLHDLDSASVALGEALRRPDRLTEASRYNLEAQRAYALNYDIAGAIRWYDQMVQVAPQSISGQNNRATYLYSVGRYEEALAGFRSAAALEPFGLRYAQIEMFNQMVTLLALDRPLEAEAVLPQLRGVFAQYAGLLLATFTGRWPAAESLSATLVSQPSNALLRQPGLTVHAGALAARGAVAAADRELRSAAAAGAGAEGRWYCQALLLLAAASGRPSGPAPPWLMGDTSRGGVLVGGLWAAGAGDTAAAHARMAALARLGPVEVRRLGMGAALLRASTHAAAGEWREAAAALEPVAVAGERDGGPSDQPSSMAARWLLAEAYAHAGRLEEAAAMFERVLDPSATPFSHLALRGLVYPFAHRRAAELLERLGRPVPAAAHRKAFARAFVTPDHGL